MSTRSEHTPGPWSYHRNINIHDQGLISSDVTGDNVAVSYNHKADDTPIIAAAPELLDALKALASSIDEAIAITDPKKQYNQRWQREASAALAAIRKAEGE